jgi:putative ABC transport system ATP-binding protein
MKERLRVTRLSKTKHLRNKRGRPQPKKILDKIDFAVNDREIFIILGPTGSGKTTLLRMLNRLETPDSGEILFDGKDTRDWDVLELRRKIGMVFQTPALFEGTVEEDILYGLRLRGEDSRSLSAELASRAGLSPDFLHRSTRELSAGEKQKVSIARALANKPEVLLMDEPSSAQDPGSRTGFENFVRNAARTGLTVVLVTHDLQQATRLADRILLLIDGKKIAEEDTEQLLSEDAPETVKKFLRAEMEVTER